MPPNTQAGTEAVNDDAAKAAARAQLEEKESEAGLADGFAAVRESAGVEGIAGVDAVGKGEGAAPVKVEEQAQELNAEGKTVEAPAKVETPADPLDTLRTDIAAIAKQLTGLPVLDQRLKSFEGRLGKMQNEQLAAASAAAKAAGGDAPTAKQIGAASISSEKFNALKKEFPEWGEAIEEFVTASRGAQGAPVDTEALRKQIKEELSAEFAPAIQAARDEGRALANIDRAHEGWEQLVVTPEFGSWLDAQPSDVKALSESSKAADAIKMLDLYADHAKAAATAAASKQRSQASLAAAAPVNGKAVGGPQIKSDEEGLADGFYAVRKASSA